jgi:hypothetical protein
MAPQYRIEVRDENWVEIITSLVTAQVKATGNKTPPVRLEQIANGVVYFIDKTFLPAPVLAKAIGAKESAVAEATDIVLKTKAAWAEMPKGNVPYSGHA